MNSEMPERPTLGARRAPRPAPDKDVDPVETPRSQPTKPVAKISLPEKGTRVPFSNRLSAKTIDTLSRVKAETKLPIYEAIEIAVATVWKDYERNK